MTERQPNEKKRGAALRVLFYAAVFCLLFLAVAPLAPMNDDWYYATAPNPGFHPSQLLPQSTFWRPLDVLFGAFMGLVPSLFPVLNRAVVVLAHVLNAALLGSILKRVGIADAGRRLATCYFLFSSAVWAVVASPDALNQAYSVLFGVLAVYCHLKHGGWWYLPLCAVALFWKESGVSWFFVIPIADAIVQGQTWKKFCKTPRLVKRCIGEAAASAAVIAAYFVLRFALYGSVTLGSETGTYQVSIFSLSTVKNMGMLFASAVSGVDALAVFGRERSWLLVGVTALLSAAFLVCWLFALARMLREKRALFPLTGLVLCALGLALPLAIIGSAGEMHAYPVLWAMALLLAFCFDRARICVKRAAAAVSCVFLAFLITSAHKLVTIYDYSARTDALTQSIAAQYDTPDAPVLFVTVANWEGYSVFDQSAAQGTYMGYSLRPYYGWKTLNHTRYDAPTEEAAAAYIASCKEEYAAVFVIRDEVATRVL